MDGVHIFIDRHHPKNSCAREGLAGLSATLARNNRDVVAGFHLRDGAAMAISSLSSNSSTFARFLDIAPRMAAEVT